MKLKKNLAVLAAVILACACLMSVSAFAEETACTHSPVVDPYQTPTCNNYGLTSGVHCGTCGEILVAQELIDPMGHCFSNGICARCGSVCPHLHPVTVAEVPSTCTVAGVGESVACSDCGKVIVAGKTLAKLPHQTFNGVCLKCKNWVEEYVIQYHLTNAVPEGLKSVYTSDAALRASVAEQLEEVFGEYHDRNTTFVLSGDAYHRINVNPYEYKIMSDADFPANGISFRMLTPEGYDKNFYEIALYHLNGEGKLEEVDFTIENCNVITTMKDNNPFVLVMFPTELTGEVKLLGPARTNYGVVAKFVNSNNIGKNLYQWQLDGEDIAGATGPEYIVKASDAGHELRCVIRSNVQTGEKISEPMLCE